MSKQQEPWQEAGGARHVQVKEGEEEGEEEGREEEERGRPEARGW
jgi:hypothetical protein